MDEIFETYWWVVYMFQTRDGSIGTEAQLITTTEGWFPIAMTTRLLEKELQSTVRIMDWKNVSREQKNEILEDHALRAAEAKALSEASKLEKDPKGDSSQSPSALKAVPNSASEHPTL